MLPRGLLLLASGAALSAPAAAAPMPYPLPANFSFGNCGDLPPAVSIPGCMVPVALAAKVSVRCSSAAGCDPGCATSALAQGVFSRYEARLSGGGGAPPPPPAVIAQQTPPIGAAAGGTRFWWRLNNTNCNLHDLRDFSCAAGPTACKAACEAHPDCGAFLLSKGGGIQVKNSSCWSDIGSLPSSDFGDNLYILRDIPEPLPLPATGGELSSVEVCIAGPSEVLGPETDESYSLSVPASSAGAVVRAPTIFGAMHGLESLTQLVDVRVGAGEATAIPSAPIEIHDAPRFSYRGLMIDSGRCESTSNLHHIHIRSVTDCLCFQTLSAN